MKLYHSLYNTEQLAKNLLENDKPTEDESDDTTTINTIPETGEDDDYYSKQ